MREALFYEKKANLKVQCSLCPHFCQINEGEKGFCGVRKNIAGKLYALTYKRIITAACDPIEKKPLYHFLPGSSAFSLGGLGCNLHCRHCQNHEISQNRDDRSIENLYSLSSEEIIRKAKEQNCSTIAWTYNEPTIWYEYIKETASLARREGLKTALISNGVINVDPLENLLPLIDAYRVDIKGFSEDFYRRLTGFPFLSTVLKSAETAFNRGCHVELVTNIIPGWNDGDKQIDKLISWIKERLSPAVPWHVTAYHPAYRMFEKTTPSQTLTAIREKGLKAGLNHIYLGNLPSDRGSDTYCPSCGMTLIKRYAMSVRENLVEGSNCPQCGYSLKMFRHDL